MRHKIYLYSRFCKSSGHRKMFNDIFEIGCVLTANGSMGSKFFSLFRWKIRCDNNDSHGNRKDATQRPSINSIIFSAFVAYSRFRKLLWHSINKWCFTKLLNVHCPYNWKWYRSMRHMLLWKPVPQLLICKLPRIDYALCLSQVLPMKFQRL